MARLTDEIIEEIHSVRQQHAARFDYDINRILDDLRASQEKHVSEGWPLSIVSEVPPVSAGSALRHGRVAYR